MSAFRRASFVRRTASVTTARILMAILRFFFFSFFSFLSLLSFWLVVWSFFVVLGGRGGKRGRRTPPESLKLNSPPKEVLVFFAGRGIGRFPGGGGSGEWYLVVLLYGVSFSIP